VRISTGSAVGLFAKGGLAEVHFIAGVVTTEDYDEVLAGTIKPEELAGWVNGVILKDYAADHISADGRGAGLLRLSAARQHQAWHIRFRAGSNAYPTFPSPNIANKTGDTKRSNHGGHGIGQL
jgi:hypothetical protein